MHLQQVQVVRKGIPERRRDGTAGVDKHFREEETGLEGAGGGGGDRVPKSWQVGLEGLHFTESLEESYLEKEEQGEGHWGGHLWSPLPFITAPYTHAPPHTHGAAP